MANTSRRPAAQDAHATSNWFQSIFHHSNLPTEDPKDLEAAFYDCLKSARYPKDIRDAVQLAVRTLEARHAAKDETLSARTISNSSNDNDKTTSSPLTADPALFFSEFVHLFWPMEMPYRETPFFRSAWSATSSELTKFCLALWMIYVPLEEHSHKGFDTANVSVYNLASQVGLRQLVEQITEELDASFVWPFHALMVSRHSRQDLAGFALSYLTPHPSLLQHGVSVVAGWQPEDLMAEDKENSPWSPPPVPARRQTGVLETIQEESICSRCSTASSSLDPREAWKEQTDTERSSFFWREVL